MPLLWQNIFTNGTGPRNPGHPEFGENAQSAGLTQHQQAKKLGKTQSAISKLESGADLELTLRELAEYATATEQAIRLNFGQPLNHVEAVKLHVIRLRKHLEELAKQAHPDASLDQAIQKFFGEAFFHLLDILSQCQPSLPHGGKDASVRFRPDGQASQLNPAPKMPQLAQV